MRGRNDNSKNQNQKFLIKEKKSMKHLFTFLAVLCLGAIAVAQVQQPDFSKYGFTSAKINGRIEVAGFDYSVPSQFATSFANWQNFPNGCSYFVPGDGSVVPFNTSATVKVNDLTTPANTETVALTGFSSAAPICAATLSTSNAHTGS